MPSSDIDLLARNQENGQGLLEALGDDRPSDREPSSFRDSKVVYLPAFAITLVQITAHPATVAIPTCAKPAMGTNLWAMGATAVIQHGTSIAEGQEYIRKILLPHDPNGIFLPPFDRSDI